jgi:quercetin dioxygenase-like cupin family protein
VLSSQNAATAQVEALTPELAKEFDQNQFNPCVGSVLVSQSERNRVWYIRLKPGQRIGFHRHVLDYFWTCLTGGEACSRINGGKPVSRAYVAGETMHMQYGAGEFMIHDLENTGDSDIAFITVEMLESANKPLPLPDGIVPTGSIPDRMSFK